jgi:hypothetical protein
MQTNQKPCEDCGGPCDEILEALRIALDLPLRCSICRAQDSPEVKVKLIGGGAFCWHCATECFS